MRPHSRVLALLLLACGGMAAGCGADAPANNGDWPPQSDGGGASQDAAVAHDAASGDTAAAPPDASSDDAGDDVAAPVDAGPRTDVLQLMEKAADWQIAAFGTTRAKSWIESTFYAGLMA